MIKIVITTDENGTLSATERQILRAIADANIATVVSEPAVEVEVQDEPKVEVKEEAIALQQCEATAPQQDDPIAEPEEEQSAPHPTSDYTEDELSQMSLSVLKGLLEDAGIDYDSFEGKNTNKKLRTLYLTGKWGDESVEDEEPADEVQDEPTAQQQEEPKAPVSTISADDIRKAMSLKRDKNRQGIMDIFAQYGASKVSDLKESDYAEVYNAINAL